MNMIKNTLYLLGALVSQELDRHCCDGPSSARTWTRPSSGFAGSRGQCWEMQDRAEAAYPPSCCPSRCSQASESPRTVGLVGTQHPSVLAVPTGPFSGSSSEGISPREPWRLPGVSVECCGLGSRAPLPAARVLLSGPTPAAHPSPASLLCRVRGVRAHSVTSSSGDRMGFSTPAAAVREVVQAVTLTWVVVS